MKQIPGEYIAVPVVTVAPAGNVGADMTAFHNAAKVYKYALRVDLAGGTSTELTLMVREADDDHWMIVGDTGNLGKLGGQALPSAKGYVFVVENIGIFDQIVLLQANDVGGAVVTTAKLTEYIESGFKRGD